MKKGLKKPPFSKTFSYLCIPPYPCPPGMPQQHLFSSVSPALPPPLSPSSPSLPSPRPPSPSCRTGPGSSWRREIGGSARRGGGQRCCLQIMGRSLKICGKRFKGLCFNLQWNETKQSLQLTLTCDNCDFSDCSLLLLLLHFALWLCRRS